MNRLNELLAQMSTETNQPAVRSVKIPKPLKKRSKAETKDSSDDEEKPRNVVEAAKKVAAAMKGADPKQTEMELLSKLLGGSAQNKASLTDVISGMKVDKEETERPTDQQPQHYRQRADFVRDNYRQREPRAQVRKNMEVPAGSVDLFGTEPLGIFLDAELKSVDNLDTWRRLEERELRLAVTHPPSNYFEKMALWTEQGKLWKFPIDNEQDIGPEAEVDFTEHVFLDELLEPWCPPKGPVRHFMELVTVGLSKNPYMTVEEKRGHINYYKDYFESKKELLEQIIIDAKEAKKTANEPKQVVAE